MPPKHFLDINALDAKTLRAIIDDAAAIKRKRKNRKAPKGLGVGEGAVARHDLREAIDQDARLLRGRHA